MTFDDVSGHSYTLPAVARMNVPVFQIILVRLEIKEKRRREKGVEGERKKKRSGRRLPHVIPLIDSGC
jgi:hypothetical protein